MRLHTSLNTPGSLDLSVAIHSASAGDVRFEQAVTLRVPRCCSSPATIRTKTRTVADLAGRSVDIQRVTSVPDGHLSDYQLVVVNDMDLEQTADTYKGDIENYVKQGGGLLVLGGERNVYGRRQTRGRARPQSPPSWRRRARRKARRHADRGQVVFDGGTQDRTGAPGGHRGGRESRPVDTVGVLIFDNCFQWAVPLRKAEDRI